ncbi:MAG: murein biosynthesis integral membrane protein MurJ [Synergistaceae bacterium]|nr:murein biosynthesis integral membrane protein MurJ [Synergistaceae bacterium]
MKKNEKLSGMVRHAITMMLGTSLSRILGLAREMFTAAFFGATRQLDAFYIAYTLANLSRQLLAEGALSASFVPIFSKTLSFDGKDKAQNLAKQSLSVLIFGATLVILVGIFLAPLLVKIMAPGFVAEDRTLAIALTRYMFPFLLFVSIGALAMGILNSMGSFFVPAIAPAVSNFAYILFLIIFMKNLTIWNLATAVLIGGICQMLVQWYWCKKMGIKLIPAMPQKNNQELKSMMTLFFPYAAGLSLNQVNPVISRIMGSFLVGGSISVLNYADRVLQLPLGLFVIAISQAVLPILSRHDAEDTESFRDFIRDALRFSLFVVLPVAFGLFLISEEIINLLFYRGAFSLWAWHATSVSLAIYGIGLPGMACSTVILRAMYARKMPKGALNVTAVTVCVNFCASFILTYVLNFEYAGLAAATAIAFTCSGIYGAWALSRNLKEKLGVFTRDWVLKMAVSIILMIFTILIFKKYFSYPLSGGLGYKSIWIVSAISIAFITYMLSTLSLKCTEWQWVYDAIKSESK